MARVRVVPEELTLVLYESARVAELAEEVADLVGVPADVEVVVEVDEELPSPLTGSYADVRDGGLALWFSGGDFEDTRRARHLDEVKARRELAMGMLRGLDRLGEGFAEAPEDAAVSSARRAMWDVSAEGRAARLGVTPHETRRRYAYRLQCGFTDAADAVYARLWDGAPISWAALGDLEASLGLAPDPAERRRTPVRAESLRRAD